MTQCRESNPSTGLSTNDALLIDNEKLIINTSSMITLNHTSRFINFCTVNKLAP